MTKYFSLPFEELDAVLNSSASAENKMKTLSDNPEWKIYVPKMFVAQENAENTSLDEDIDQLIEWYVNKKSKRVTYAGKKLKKAFLSLSSEQQRKVGLALLTGSDSDTDFVCKRLVEQMSSKDEDWIVNWRSRYHHYIEDVWIKYHGESCGKLLIAYLDKEVVMKYRNILLQDYYLYVEYCKRFANSDSQAVDSKKLKSRATINEYLSVMAQMPNGISADEARHLLYYWVAVIADAIVNPNPDTKDIFWDNATGCHRIINACGLDTALYYILKMNLNDVVKEFIEWDSTVTENFKAELGDRDDSMVYGRMFATTAAKSLPEKYKHLTGINPNFIHKDNFWQPYSRPTHLEFLVIDIESANRFMAKFNEYADSLCYHPEG